MTEKIIVLLMTIQMLITGIAAKQDQKLQPPTGTEIKGEVKDQQGAVIVGAKVVLEDSQKKTKETATDDHGRFAFHGVPAGSCIIRTIADGFAPHEEQIKIDTPGPHPQVTITMFPEIKETVSVNDDTSTVTVDPEHASGTQIIKEKDIKELPDDPDEFANRLQLMAAMGGGMPGGATVTVDGFIVHGRLPSKGSIREIRINPDLYSAEYDKPPYKGGRIEIFTKPGAESFHGSGFLNFNDSALNARNAFA
ncbi:MAG TPA: carboxypeptidase-like regulatory domain-containing protein, partial [Blastocatellia bacterium]|nr:carboxypeptidase-like regulatory domain-containing protein [Blastocatellia bacterium]